MELALYHPSRGYYSSPDPRYGRQGDFLTAPSASRWYGAVVASLLSRLAERSGPITLVDLGSGDGSFVERVIQDARVSGLRQVVSIEGSAAMRALQEQRTERFETPVRCFEDLSEAAPMEAPVVVHASELFDAMPVHRVAMRAGGLSELWVRSDDGELTWQERPASRDLEEYFEVHGVSLSQDQLAEINLRARSFHREILERAGSDSLAMVLDYGYPARRLYDGRARRQGSLASYSEHRASRDPLQAPGDSDITAHVNWDDLRAAARDADWVELGLWPLAELLVRAGIDAVMEGLGVGPNADMDARTLRERQEIKRLLDPDGMGSDLKMLVQASGTMIEAARGLLTLRR
jgi:SAM-dependent MidA family methyltransferase